MAAIDEIALCNFKGSGASLWFGLGDITVLAGPNQSGKSRLIEAIYFARFGRTTRLSSQRLVELMPPDAEEAAVSIGESPHRLGDGRFARVLRRAPRPSMDVLSQDEWVQAMAEWHGSKPKSKANNPKGSRFGDLRVSYIDADAVDGLDLSAGTIHKSIAAWMGMDVEWPGRGPSKPTTPFNPPFQTTIEKLEEVESEVFDLFGQHLDTPVLASTIGDICARLETYGIRWDGLLGQMRGAALMRWSIEQWRAYEDKARAAKESTPDPKPEVEAEFNEHSLRIGRIAEELGVGTWNLCLGADGLSVTDQSGDVDLPISGMSSMGARASLLLAIALSRSPDIVLIDNAERMDERRLATTLRVLHARGIQAVVATCRDQEWDPFVHVVRL